MIGIRHVYMGAFALLIGAAVVGMSGHPLITASSAHAQARAAGNYVVARSKFGNGTVVGAVRRTSVGLQVRLPGGSWVYCGRSCAETLRVESVDFWQNEQGAGPNGAIDNEAGILGNLLKWGRSF